jgi:uncharacterized membrane protein YqaE (UPF0057 family)
MFLLCILLPPVAVLMCGKPITALFNLLLTCLLWVPGVIHAFAVVNAHQADKRTARLVRAIKDKHD